MVESHDFLVPGAKHRTWMTFNLGTALILATVLALVTLVLTKTGDPVVPGAGEGAVTEAMVAAPPTVAASTVAEPTQRDTAAEATDLGRDGAEDAALTTMPAAVLSLAGRVTNMGPTEVGFVSNFPTADYTWARVELGGVGQTELSWLGELNGTLVAVGCNWNDDWSRQTLVAYLSADGLDWETGGSEPIPERAYVSRVVGDGDRIYAFAEGWAVSGAADDRLYVTEDGVDWSEVKLHLGVDDADYVYIQNAAAGPAGLALAVTFESYPETQPALLDFGDVQVGLDYRSNTFRVLDTASGDELMSGRFEDLYHWGGEEAQPVYDPETGEVVVSIPRAVWDAAYSAYYDFGTPLPLPVYSDGPGRDPITIEYGGFVVEVSEEQGSYRVLDADTGAESVSGTLDYLYQGPPPRLIDPDTGDVVLDVSWEEWWAAEEAANRYQDSGDYTSTTKLLTSVDGETWSATDLPGNYGSNVSALVPTDDGFVALVDTYSESGDHSSVWTMENSGWSSVQGSSTGIWFNGVVRTSGGFVGVGDGPGGSTLWSSSDAVDWTSVFGLVAQDDGSYAYLSDVASDDSGTIAALVQRQRWFDYEPLVMQKDGYTLAFPDGETALIVTDATGQIVLELGWNAFDNDGAEPVTWENGVTYIALDNGEVLAITDAEANRALQDWSARQGTVGVSVLLGESGTWSEAIVDVDGGLSFANQVYLVGGRIIVAGTDYGDEHMSYENEGGSAGNSVVIIVGARAT
jgi:hypothetical protein